ncbi:MAG: transposase [Thiomonas delicata]|jgi:hypothetical protein
MAQIGIGANTTGHWFHRAWYRRTRCISANPVRVEQRNSWFNRFRKLLARDEKLERSFLAVNHFAAAIIAFHKVPLSINIITNRFLVSASLSQERIGRSG